MPRSRFNFSHLAKAVFNPIRLLFLLAFTARAWLLYSLDASSVWIVWPASLVFVLIIAVLTWFSARWLAKAADLSERGEERFMVMSILGTLMIPLPFAVLESMNWHGEFSLLMLALPSLTGNWYSNVLHIVTVTVVALALLVNSGVWVLHFWTRWPIGTRLRKLTLLPLVYCLGLLLLFFLLFTFNSGSALWRIVLVLFGLGLPFLLAALFTTPYMLTQWYEEQKRPQRVAQKVAFHIAILLLVALYFCSQLLAYMAMSGFLQ